MTGTSLLLLALFWCSAGRAASPDLLWRQDFRAIVGIDEPTPLSTWLIPVLADVEGDSAPEIVLGFTHPDRSRMFVLDGRDGTVRSTCPLPAKVFNFAVTDDTTSASRRVIVGLMNGYVHDYDVRSWALLDSVGGGFRIRTLCCADLDGDGVSDYATVGGENVVAAWNGRTGSNFWQKTMPSFVHNVLADDLDGDGALEVAFGSANGLNVVDGVTGASKWEGEPEKSKFMGKSFNVGASALGAASRDGKRMLVVGNQKGGIAVVDGRTGAVVIERKSGAGYITNLSTGDLDGDGITDVVFTSIDHKVYALRGTDLGEIWCFMTGDEVYSSPALGDLDGDGLTDIAIVSDDDTAYGIDGRSGQALWRYELGSDCQAGYAVLGDVDRDGFVDVVLHGTRDGILPVLRTSGKCEPGALIWPQKWGNGRNTAACTER